MGFLKKFGAVILKITEIATGIAPIISTAFPGSAEKVQVVSQDLAQIAEAVLQVEVIGQVLGSPGPDKLRAVTPLVAQVILRSALVANHKIADPVKFQVGAAKVADGIADILNSLEDKVESTSKV